MAVTLGAALVCALISVWLQRLCAVATRRDLGSGALVLALVMLGIVLTCRFQEALMWQAGLPMPVAANVVMCAVILGCAAPLSVADAATHRLPNTAVLAATVLVFLTAVVLAALQGDWERWLLWPSVGLGITAVAGIGLALVFPRVLGMGDAKYLPIWVFSLLAMHGALGLIAGFFAMLVCASIYALVLTFKATTSGRHTSVPLGPALCCAQFAVLLLVVGL